MAGERAPALAVGPTVVSGLLVAALFAALLAFLLLAQNRMPAFKRGHHGWVSANTLAMVGHLRTDTSLVGQTVQFLSTEEAIPYDHFHASVFVFNDGLMILPDSYHQQ